MLQYARELIATIMQKDPAAHSRWEVVLAYPGFHAVMIHRLSVSYTHLTLPTTSIV